MEQARSVDSPRYQVCHPTPSGLREISNRKFIKIREKHWCGAQRPHDPLPIKPQCVSKCRKIETQSSSYHERLYIVCQEEKIKSRALKNEVQMSINAVRSAILRYNSWKQ